MDHGDSEKIEINIYTRWILSVLGVILILACIAVFLLCVSGFTDMTPEQMSLSTFFIVGVGLILIVQMPWQSISFGGVEVERAQRREEAQDYAQQITELRQLVVELSNGGTALEGSTFKLPSEQDKQLVLQFLSKWDTWGFNIPRIIQWGGKRSGFARLSELDQSDLQAILTDLIASGAVKTWISKKGHMLYQKA
ncbi:MAG: hypothetical protein AAGI37_08385 [Planctomycetota bacterium]